MGRGTVPQFSYTMALEPRYPYRFLTELMGKVPRAGSRLGGPVCKTHLPGHSDSDTQPLETFTHCICIE